MSSKIFRKIAVNTLIGAVSGGLLTFGMTQTILGERVQEKPVATTTVGLVAGLFAGLILGFKEAAQKERVIYLAPQSVGDELLKEWQSTDDEVKREHIMAQIVELNKAEAIKAKAQAQITLNATTQAVYAGTEASSDQ